MQEESGQHKEQARQSMPECETAGLVTEEEEKEEGDVANIITSARTAGRRAHILAAAAAAASWNDHLVDAAGEEQP